MVKLDKYRIFCAVSEQGGFSRAAAKLFMTQSAVSQAIKSLEAELGATLFLRGSREISLTPEGKILLEYVTNALSLLDTAEQNLQKLKQLEMGELRIGVGDTISRYYLLPLLEKFHELYPHIKLKIYNRVSRDTAALLRAGKIDLAFVNLPICDDGLTTRRVMAIHDIFVAGPKFAHLQSKKIKLADICDLPLILLEDASNSRASLDGFFRAHGLDLTPEFELGSHDLLLEFAHSNLGISCVIREFSAQYLQSGALFELNTSTKIPPRAIGACTLAAVTLSRATEEFLKLL